MLMIVTIIATIVYVLYAQLQFNEYHRRIPLHSHLLKDVSGYMGWNIVDSITNVVMDQGINVMLNMFFGPIVNTARGVAINVKAQIAGFTSNIQAATNPQIIKYYAANEREEFQGLVIQSSKVAYFLLLLIAVPIIFEAPFIFDIWLGQGKYPEITIPYVRIILITTLIDTFICSAYPSIQASGKLRLVGINYICIRLGALILSYLFLLLDKNPMLPMYALLCASVIQIFIVQYITQKVAGIPLSLVIKKVFWPDFLVSILSFAATLGTYLLLRGFPRIPHFFILCIISEIFTCSFIFGFGFNKHERSMIVALIKQKFSS